MAWSYPVRVEPKCEQTIFSRSNYQFWFATRWFGNFREVSRPEGESRLIPFKNGLGVRFGSDDSGTPSWEKSRRSAFPVELHIAFDRYQRHPECTSFLLPSGIAIDDQFEY